VLHGADDWNPSDYAHHLTRRARGLAFWFSLITYGTDAYTSAIESSINLTHQVAREMKKNPNIELINEPQLSIILFKRKDWNETDYQKWAAELLQSQIAFVAPSAWNGEVVGRLVFLHPSTTLEMALAAVPK
jgi:glutamate/tyrosine decarboxylase-like PLP-dependent enzyme